MGWTSTLTEPEGRLDAVVRDEYKLKATGNLQCVDNQG